MTSKTKRLFARVRSQVEQLARATEEAKQSGPVLKYLAFASRFRRYSFHNTMLIFSQKPEATHVAGYRTWQKMGRYVRKGEKGIAILVPMKIKVGKEDDGEDDAEIVRFRTGYIFDVSQTEGEDLPEPSVLSDQDCSVELTEGLLDTAASKGIMVSFDKLPDGQYGVSKGESIVISDTLQGADRFSALAHELAHELLHQDGKAKQVDHKTREIEAETVAHVVCRHFDIPSSAPTYLALHQATADEIVSRLSNVVDAIQAIVSGVTQSIA